MGGGGCVGTKKFELVIGLCESWVISGQGATGRGIRFLFKVILSYTSVQGILGFTNPYF